METDLNRIKELAEQRENAYWSFRRYLKGEPLPSKKIDTMVHELFKDISSKIDCTACANCCREIRPGLSEDEIRVFADGLKMPVEQFTEQYITKCDTPGVYMFKEKPCPFLKDNNCSNYEFRPEDCRSFPHLHKEDFTGRLIRVVCNCSVCPIVFNVYEELRKEIRRMQKHKRR